MGGRNRRGVEEVDLDFAVGDHDALGDGFNDPTALFVRHGRPPGIQILGFADDFLLGEVGDLEDVDLRLGPGNFILKLFLSF